MKPFNVIFSFSKYLLKGYCAFLLLFIITYQSFAQGAQITAKLDSTSILIGQELKLHLEATFPAQDTIKWPSFNDTITKNIEIVSVSSIDTSYDQNDVSIKQLAQDITITSFDSGYFPIPPIKFIIKGNEYYSEPLLIQVLDMPVDTSKGIADIKEPYQVPFSFEEWLIHNKNSIAIGILILLIIIGIIYYLKKRKNQPVIESKPIPKIPPHKLAIKRLNDLEHKKLWQNGKTKAYHSELSDIVRTYIEQQFNINALEQTSWETIESFKHLTIDHKLKDKLQFIFSIADMVKFAKESPIASDNETCLKNSYDFVNQTIPSKVENNE